MLQQVATVSLQRLRCPGRQPDVAFSFVVISTSCHTTRPPPLSRPPLLPPPRIPTCETLLLPRKRCIGCLSLALRVRRVTLSFFLVLATACTFLTRSLTFASSEPCHGSLRYRRRPDPSPPLLFPERSLLCPLCHARRDCEFRTSRRVSHPVPVI